MSTPGSSFTPTPLDHEDNLEKRHKNYSGDGSCKFEPRSSDKDDTRVGTLVFKLPHPTNVRTLNFDRFIVHQLLFSVARTSLPTQQKNPPTSRTMITPLRIRKTVDRCSHLARENLYKNCPLHYSLASNKVTIQEKNIWQGQFQTY
ncbi:hypothetical protein TNCV_3783901 [Trichonephila clavipes]|nr:hypothetical protein TNCV_3783901 [Trichonephila clavipes]